MSSSSLTTSLAPMSNEKYLLAWFTQLALETSQPGAPPPYLPSNTPYWMVSQLEDLYSQAMNCPVTTRLTPGGQLTFEMASSLSSTESMPTAASPTSISSADVLDRKSKAKVPRPANAFILYRQHKHPAIKAQFPGIVNNDISKKVAALWKDESEDVKATWKAKADEAKQQHLQQHPDYSYQPRKSSEKKRRMTKRKMATTTAAVVFVDDKAQHVQGPQQPLPAFTLNNIDLSPIYCNPAAMGHNAVQTYDNIEHLLNIVMGDETTSSTIDFAATHDLSVGLAFCGRQPANFEALKMFPSDSEQRVDDFIDANFASGSATGVGAVAPAEPSWEHRDNHGLMMAADQIQNQQFLNSANAEGLEQMRQEELFEQSDDFDNVWHPNPYFFG
uniref:Mating type protein MAT1-2 n=1 Tax=Venturia inaequalis TaxID=5025 RepID=A0A2L0WQK7_VENIN|nr:mating type protein MAT1-2 [Venturia inaequalis]